MSALGRWASNPSPRTLTQLRTSDRKGPGPHGPGITTPPHLVGIQLEVMMKFPQTRMEGVLRMSHLVCRLHASIS